MTAIILPSKDIQIFKEGRLVACIRSQQIESALQQTRRRFVLSHLLTGLASSVICSPFQTAWGTIGELGKTFFIFGLQNTLAKSFPRSVFISGINSIVIPAMNYLSLKTLIHESGHFWAMKYLFQGTPRIEVDFPSGGRVHWARPHLMTPLGRQLGYSTSLFLVSLGGPVLENLASTIQLIAGLALRRSYPNVSRALMGCAIFGYMDEAIYALSALSPPASSLTGHDFRSLRIDGGVHPLAACATIIAIPIITTLGFMLVERLFGHAKSFRQQPHVIPVLIQRRS